MKNPFSELLKSEWAIYIVSLVVVIVSNLFGKHIDYMNMISTVLGVTSLIFIAKGNVWGQIISLPFVTMYAIISFMERYYGEVIICLTLSIPLAVVSIVTWVKNPYRKGENVVKVALISLKEKVFLFFLDVVIVIVFYFILQALGTNNLIVSTISVGTSFCASYLMIRRNSFYAIAYTLNDVVLIVLWVMASIVDPINIPMVACFSMFLFNDLYGFIRWRKREKEQGIR